MEFKTRAKHEPLFSGLSQLSHWVSECGNYRVSRSLWRGKADMPEVWYACVRDSSGWTVIDTFRKRRSAEQACEKHRRDRIELRASNFYKN